ncbi:helix-turn-helix domain-containing protein [Rhizobium leguminosarum]|uniref:helix-turn-helix domain-containing protein n=1 Tax=Rhizobium leguminosarum TaxID=384 RepID=UPI0012F7A766
MSHRYPVSNSVGRPSSFQPEYVDQVERLCRTGAIDTDIAEFFNVAVSTVYEWKIAYPEFSEAIKRGKAKVDREVADKLIDRAMGAKFVVQKEVKLKSVSYLNGKKDSEEERVEVVDLHMEAPPDTQALIFFLKNRRPDLYRERQEVEHSANKEAPPVFLLKIDNS